jgi:hypothetical protein
MARVKTGCIFPLGNLHQSNSCPFIIYLFFFSKNFSKKMALYSQLDVIDMFQNGLFPYNMCIAIIVPGHTKRPFVRHDMKVIEASHSFYPDALSRAADLPPGTLFVGCCYPELQEAEHTYGEPLGDFWREEQKRQLTPPPSLVSEVVDVPVKKLKLLKEEF